MAITKTLTENMYSTNKSTWTLSLASGLSWTATSSGINISAPSLTAKYTGSNKGYASAYACMSYYIGSNQIGYVEYQKQPQSGGWAMSWASGTTYTLPTPYVNEFYISSAGDIFNSTNSTTRTLTVSASSVPESGHASIWLISSKNADWDTNDNGYETYSTVSWGNVGTITLNAPPTFSASALSKDTSGEGYYKNTTTVTTTISSLSAKYGGTISSAVLTIGNQTATRTTNGSLSILLNAEGTFTPTLTVTDSRGQIATQSFDPITVTSIPPTFDVSVTSSAPYTSTVSTYSVTISNATSTVSTIASSKLTVGTQTVTGSGNGNLSLTLANGGEFTPTVSVTDSNGVTATQTMPSITVQAYQDPTVNFTLSRIASTSPYQVDNDGEHCLIEGVFTYDSVTSLKQPTVSVTNENGQAVTVTTTWYGTYDANGFSNAVSFPYSTTNPATLYAHIAGTLAGNQAYNITVTAQDNNNKSSVPITQSILTAFYTIDFQAGGKEIAFGGPADDTLTQTQQQVGLFKCDMESIFNGVNEIQSPYYTIDTTAVSGTDYDLYTALTALGWQSVVDDGLDVKETLTKVLQQFSAIATQFSSVATQLTNLMPTRGSNTNGDWVKYPDGTMICWGYKTVTSSTSATSAYFKYYGTAGATFPQSFAGTPRVVSNIQKAAHYWNTTVTSASATSCTLYAAGNSNTSCIVDYIAVGRWK